MSRTFRCRHLPLARGVRFTTSARRIIDGRGFSWRRLRDLARAEVETLYGPRPEPSERLIRSKGLTHEKYHRSVQVQQQILNVKVWVVVKPAWRETLPGRLMRTYEAWEWDQEVERIEYETIVPVSSWHPFQRHPSTGSRKKAERVAANRVARRRTHQMLQSEVIDEEWEGHFPGRRDYFNWRSIY